MPDHDQNEALQEFQALVDEQDPLNAAVMQLDSDHVQTLLAKEDTNPNTKNTLGQTPLTYIFNLDTTENDTDYEAQSSIFSSLFNHPITHRGIIFVDNIKYSFLSFSFGSTIFLLTNPTINATIKQAEVWIRIVVLLVASVALISFLASFSFLKSLLKNYLTAAYLLNEPSNYTVASAFKDGCKMAIGINPAQPSRQEEGLTAPLLPISSQA